MIKCVVSFHSVFIAQWTVSHWSFFFFVTRWKNMWNCFVFVLFRFAFIVALLQSNLRSQNHQSSPSSCAVHVVCTMYPYINYNVCLWRGRHIFLLAVRLSCKITQCFFGFIGIFSLKILDSHHDHDGWSRIAMMMMSIKLWIL